MATGLGEKKNSKLKPFKIDLVLHSAYGRDVEWIHTVLYCKFSKLLM